MSVWLAGLHEKLRRWKAAKTILDKAKRDEMTLRKECATLFFPNPKMGTNTVSAENGAKVKLVSKLNYSVDTGILATLLGTKDKEVTAVVNKVIEFQPKLKTKEYKQLSDVEKAIIDKCITAKPGAPTLSIVPPKGAE